jgi:glutamyl-tRNA reductase
MPPEELATHIYQYIEDAAVRHLFAVAAGLDSMVLGETQILGQVKEAFALAQGEHTTGPILDGLFRAALNLGKQARTRTGISRGCFSIGHCAVELARAIFGSLDTRQVLILGAGQMSEIMARHLICEGASTVLVANRTLARARELAEQIGAEAVPFDELEDHLVRADVVVTSTGAPHALIRAEALRQVMRRRRNRPLCLIDVAVPRDVEPAAGHLDNVFLYNIDDLQCVIDEERLDRHIEVEKVEQIIEAETDRFVSWYSARDAVPTLKALRGKLEEIRQAELARAAGRLDGLREEDRKLVEELTQSLLNKVMHTPTVVIKEAAKGAGDHRLEVIRELFGLDSDGEEERP